MCADKLTLCHSSLCFRSIRIAALLERFGVAFSSAEVNFASPVALKEAVPASIYLETPILISGARIVEDARAIIRYLDEFHFGQRLSGLSAARLSWFFEEMDRLDDVVFPALMAPLVYEEALAGKVKRATAEKHFNFPLDASVYDRLRPALEDLERRAAGHAYSGANLSPEHEYLVVSISSVLKRASSIAACASAAAACPALSSLLYRPQKVLS